jgi:hypothetical protein
MSFKNSVLVLFSARYVFSFGVMCMRPDDAPSEKRGSV